jgi:2'-5' RNA ligase
MFTIASLLDPESDVKVKSLWDQLEISSGLKGVKKSPLPHFSWQVAESYSLNEADKRLAQYSRKYTPFNIKVSGLGIFTGTAPVLYLALVNTCEMIGRHAELWKALANQSNNPSNLYCPGEWVPHITLAYGDVDVNKLTSAVQLLSTQAFHFDIKINSIVLAYFENDIIGVHTSYKFTGKKG